MKIECEKQVILKKYRDIRNCQDKKSISAVMKDLELAIKDVNSASNRIFFLDDKRAEKSKKWLDDIYSFLTDMLNELNQE